MTSFPGHVTHVTWPNSYMWDIGHTGTGHTRDTFSTN